MIWLCWMITRLTLTLNGIHAWHVLTSDSEFGDGNAFNLSGLLIEMTQTHDLNDLGIYDENYNIIVVLSIMIIL